MVQILPRQPSTFEKIMGPISEGIGNIAGNMTNQKKQREQSEALERLGIDTKGAKDPEVLKALLGSHFEMEKEKSKQQGELTKQNTQKQENRAILRKREQELGLENGELEPYVSKPNLAPKPQKSEKKTQASQPIDPEQLKKIEAVRKTPEYSQADELGKYQLMTSAGVSRENAKAEADISGEKLKRSDASFDKSYKFNEPFINETTSKYQAFESETKPRLMYLSKEAKNEDLIGPTGAAFLEAMGIPLGALENPNSEVYQKLSQDLLKGLPESYGSRILKVEVDNFLKTIPTLLNSPEGRRMIASNMLKLGEMKEVFYNEMRKQQKESIENNKMPLDFQQNVFDAVRPQIDRVNREFSKMSEITSVPPNTVPFFNPNGEISFVPKEMEQWAVDNGGKRIW